MQKRKIFGFGLALVTGIAITCQGQEYEFKFKGTLSQTNGLGKIVTTPITEANLLKDIADRAGVDPATLGIAYHVNGTAFGDTVDVINPATGAVLDTVFGLYFSDAFGRQSLPTANGEKSLPYIYTPQNTHSLGSALMTKTVTVSKGQTNTVFIATNVRYEITPTGTNGTKIILGSFKVSKPLVFGN
jgi:hypothetical protein